MKKGEKGRRREKGIGRGETEIAERRSFGERLHARVV